MRTSLGEVATATGGVLHGPAQLGVTAVVIDSRTATPGSLFVALPGERVDGHAFAEQAVRAGAVAALVTRPVHVPHVIVSDAVAALGALAGSHRRTLSARVTGITGSVGKTSTKDLLTTVLGQQGLVVGPPGNYNNDLGLPITVLGASDDAAHLVLEMGSRAPGDIARLCEIARPDTAVVLNVGSAHLGQFGSLAAIAAAKAELVSGTSGAVVLNADDPLVAAMGSLAPGRVRTFGAAGEVRGEGVAIGDDGCASYALVAEEGRAEVSLRLVGSHQVTNSLAAATVALTYGVGIEQIAAALSIAVPRSRWRMEVGERADGVTVINDAYNANPESARAALGALMSMTRARRRRSWAVLGEMGELGDRSVEAHEALGRFAAGLGVQRILVVGEGARPIHRGAASEPGWAGESTWAPDLEAALEVLREQLRPGDVALVKASRAAGFERVAAAVLGEARTGEGGHPSAMRDNREVSHRNRQRR